MDNNALEQALKAKGKTAPRVTKADLDANIVSEHYFTASQAVGAGYTPPEALDLLTFCVLVLRNGYTVTGESACASPENFDAEIGRQLARTNAVNKVWALMGYALKERLHQRAQAVAMLPVDPMFDGFKAFESKPIYRMAMEITDDSRVTEIATNDYSYEGIRFKAYEQPKTGDYICRLSMDDTYHVSRKVFFERNHVE